MWFWKPDRCICKVTISWWRNERSATLLISINAKGWKSPTKMTPHHMQPLSPKRTTFTYLRCYHCIFVRFQYRLTGTMKYWSWTFAKHQPYCGIWYFDNNGRFNQSFAHKLSKSELLKCLCLFGTQNKPHNSSIRTGLWSCSLWPKNIFNVKQSSSHPSTKIYIWWKSLT